VSQALKFLRNLFTARLSRRITLWVFLSILVVEVIILIPSVQRRRREVLAHLGNVASAMVSVVMDLTPPEADGTALLQQFRQISQEPLVLGGILYEADGQVVGSFGTVPEISFARALQGDRHRASMEPAAYDMAWELSQGGERYILVLRLDTRGVRQEIYAFIGRITGLVVIIALFVTIATMITLNYLVITPVYRLRGDLQQAGESAGQDGPSPQFLSTQTPRQDEMGDVIVAFEQMYQQVTRAIAERKESEERFRMLVEQAADAFFVINATGRFIEVNQRACETLGYTHEELLKLSVWDVEQRFNAETFQQVWQELSSGSSMTREGLHCRKDGTTFPVEVGVALFEAGGEKFALALARDITERKQAAKVRERLAEIGELAAMIVHEVRNPLTTVMMGLKSLSSLELSERYQLRLALAQDEADRLQRLLNEILLYARDQVLTTELLDLNILFRDEMLAPIQNLPIAQERQVNLTVPEHPVLVWGDRDKIKQVFINLLTNACEAVPSGDTITWIVAPEAEQCLVRVTVHNGGDPIPPDILSQMTKPFFTTKSSGNGLGLAIVKRIVEAHQGQLALESSTSTGTCITVTLPLCSEATPPAEIKKL
jgi:PAS domain S-box-containing protein